MKKILLILVVTGIFLAVGCNNTKPEENGIKIIEIDLDQAKRINTAEWFDSVQLVPLETTDQSLFSSAGSVILNEDFIYLYDRKVRAILIFDHNTGKFIKSTSHLFGQGPNDYINILDFDIDKLTNDLIVLDIGSQKIKRYSADLDFINDHDIALSNLLSTVFFKPISDEIFLLSNEHKEEEELVKVFSVKEQKIIEKICPIVMGVDAKKISSPSFFYEIDNQVCLYTRFPHSHIYHFDSTKLEFTPKIEFRVKQNKSINILPDQDDRYYTRKRNGEEDFAAIMNICENKRYYFTTIRYRTKSYHHIYDKETGKSRIVDFEFLDIGELIPPKVIDDKAIYVFRDVSKIRPFYNLPSLDDKYKKMIENASEDDNPFIIKLFLK